MNCTPAPCWRRCQVGAILMYTYSRALPCGCALRCASAAGLGRLRATPQAFAGSTAAPAGAPHAGAGSTAALAQRLWTCQVCDKVSCHSRADEPRARGVSQAREPRGAPLLEPELWHSVRQHVSALSSDQACCVAFCRSHHPWTSTASASLLRAWHRRPCLDLGSSLLRADSAKFGFC